MKKNLKFLVFALIIIGIVGLWQASVLKTKNRVLEQNRQEQLTSVIDLTFTFDANNQKAVEYQLPENNTKSLFAITQEIAGQQAWDLEYKDYGEMGYLVTKIDTLENGQNNKYWQYYANGQMPQVSANKYTPKSGEKIEWLFAESTF